MISGTGYRIWQRGAAKAPRDTLKYVARILLSIGSIAMIFPFYFMVTTAFKTPAEALRVPPTLWPHVFSTVSFERVVQQFPFVRVFRNSLIVASSVTLINLYTSAHIGYVLSKIEFKGRDAMFIAIISTMMIPFSAVVIPFYNMFRWLKMINTLWALIVPFAFSAFGIFLMRQFIMGIPNELIDAARIDGASEYGILLRIIFPLIQAPLSALGVLTFCHHWDSFFWPLIAIQNSKLATIPLGLMVFRGLYFTDTPSLVTATMITSMPLLIVFLIFQQKMIEGIALTGLKL